VIVTVSIDEMSQTRRVQAAEAKLEDAAMLLRDAVAREPSICGSSCS